MNPPGSELTTARLELLIEKDCVKVEPGTAIS
jgi:hypothetical protein